MLRIGRILIFSLISLPGTLLWAQSDQNPEQIEDQDAADLDEGSAWWADLYGYVRAGFEHVQHDSDYLYVGANNGFVLHNARLGLSGGNVGWGLGFQISVDGAEDVRENINNPQGDLDVRLRDAFVREDLFEGMLGLQMGQFKLPFSAEELMSTGDLMFVSRAVGLSGVPAGRGIEQEGVVFDRDLGMMLSSGQPISFGSSPLALGYYIAVSNGNGANEFLNDNNQLALTGRLELYLSEMLRLGGGVHTTERTVGEQPNHHDEKDFAYSVDLLVNWSGLELFGQYTSMVTSYPTMGTSDREQMAYHVGRVRHPRDATLNVVHAIHSIARLPSDAPK